MQPEQPWVLLPADNRSLDDSSTAHLVLTQYVQAVRLAGALPVMLPWAEADEIDRVLDGVDGVLLTGSPSNVQPSFFGQAVHDRTLPLDPQRDAWTLPLARRALERGVPLLGLCRGAQEVNVALGGSLHQAVHEVPGKADHRDRESDPSAVQWGPAHDVALAADGLLHQLLGSRRLTVNSLHGQGVDRLASGLRVEATAPDGLVEAFTHPAAPGFNLCVQWHPEWMAADNPASMRLLQAFGEAACAWRQRRLQR